MNDKIDLEAQLHAWYSGFTPGDSGPAVSGVASVIASARERGNGASRFRRMRPRLALAAIAAVAVALIAVPLWWRPSVTPLASPTATAPSPRPTATGMRSSAPTAAPSGSASAQPTSLSDELQGAAVDEAGPIPGGGVWAVSGEKLLISLDGGGTWTLSTAPATPSSASFITSTAFADADHAWTIRAGADSHTGAQDDFVSLFVYRTADGGRTWQSATIPGNFAWCFYELVFADAQHGFLNATDCQTISKTALYRTSDGGATWTAGPIRAVGDSLSVSDATTLWVSSSGGGEACNMCNEPLLQVSRDSGRTWSASPIPGYEGKLTSDTLGAGGSPVFLDPSDGYFVVADASSEVFRTTDAGRTWSRIAATPRGISVTTILDATHWFGDSITGTETSGVATADGGKTWHSGPSSTQAMKVGYWFTDTLHGGFVEMPGQFGLPARVLYLTSDGGVTWNPANFGTAGPSASQPTPESDQMRAEGLVSVFDNSLFAPTSGQSSLIWGSLSAYSQKEFGTAAAFEAKQKPYAVSVQGSGGVTTDGSLLLTQADKATLGAAYEDVIATADSGRARVVIVYYGDVSAPSHKQIFIAAPLAGTENWRLWIVSQT